MLYSVPSAIHFNFPPSSFHFDCLNPSLSSPLFNALLRLICPVIHFNLLRCYLHDFLSCSSAPHHPFFLSSYLTHPTFNRCFIFLSQGHLLSDALQHYPFSYIPLTQIMWLISIRPLLDLIR